MHELILAQKEMKAGFEQAGLSVNPANPEASLQDISARFGISREAAIYTIGFGYQWFLSPYRSQHYPGAGLEHFASRTAGQKVLRLGLPSEFALFEDMRLLGEGPASYLALDINPFSVARANHYTSEKAAGSVYQTALHNLEYPLEGMEGQADVAFCEFLFEGMDSQTARMIVENTKNALSDDGEMIVKFVAVNDVQAGKLYETMRVKAQLWKRKPSPDFPFDWENMAAMERADAVRLGEAYADHVYGMNYERSSGKVTFRNLGDFLMWAQISGLNVTEEYEITQADLNEVSLSTDVSTQSEGVFIAVLKKPAQFDSARAKDRAEKRRQMLARRK